MAEDNTPPHVGAMPPRIERPDTTQFNPSARFAAGPDFKFWVT